MGRVQSLLQKCCDITKDRKGTRNSLSGPPHEPQRRTPWADPVVTSPAAGAAGPRAWTRYVTAARASRQVRSGRWRREPLGRATHGKSSPRVRRGPDGRFFRLVSGFPGSPRGPRGWRLPRNDGAAALLPLGRCEIPSPSSPRPPGQTWHELQGRAERSCPVRLGGSRRDRGKGKRPPDRPAPG